MGSRLLILNFGMLGAAAERWEKSRLPYRCIAAQSAIQLLLLSSRAPCPLPKNVRLRLSCLALKAPPTDHHMFALGCVLNVGRSIPVFPILAMIQSGSVSEIGFAPTFPGVAAPLKALAPSELSAV